MTRVPSGHQHSLCCLVSVTVPRYRARCCYVQKQMFVILFGVFTFWPPCLVCQQIPLKGPEGDCRPASFPEGRDSMANYSAPLSNKIAGPYLNGRRNTPTLWMIGESCERGQNRSQSARALGPGSFRPVFDPSAPVLCSKSDKMPKTDPA